MPDKPYEDRGIRLRARRKELQKAGVLDADLDTVARKAGVSRSAFQMWERGETWPTPKNKPALLALLDWSEQELDHGVSEGGRQDGMGYHPVSPVELEMLALFRALGPEQVEFLHKLKARIAARQTLGQHVKGELNTVHDTQVVQRMPVTDPSKPKKPTKAKRA